ncbi:hypothetical protein [Streptomyces sp. NPDC057280]|uniref:hypothetical protein n=1 Tax=Streptomyces sp. NPDC057280 TaxID=3346081 RepID=UPI0036335008
MTTERVSGLSGPGEWSGGSGERIRGSGERIRGSVERIRGAGEWVGGARERGERVDAVTDGQETELPTEGATEFSAEGATGISTEGATGISAEIATDISTEILAEIPMERRPRGSVRVMPLWARPLAEPEEPGWSLAARRPATARSLERAGV